LEDGSTGPALDPIAFKVLAEVTELPGTSIPLNVKTLSLGKNHGHDGKKKELYMACRLLVASSCTR
jgi:hypothetical protein